jgi:hypothetical protein
MISFSCLCFILGRHGERISPSGAWVIPNNFRYHVDRNLTSALISFMARKNLTSVIDIGAGKGAYVSALNRSGYMVDAVDGVKNIAQLSNGYVRTHDLTIPLIPCVEFDLVLSLEVAEHIPKAFESTYLHNLKCSSKRFIIISWASPGQFGSGHVNLLEFPKVIKKMKIYGFKYNKNETKSLRANSSLPWFRRNLAVYNKIL